MVKIQGSCYSCGYPVAADYPGEKVTCPMCGADNESVTAITDMTIPSWLVALLGGLTAGVILGPVLLASTESGSQWLARKARERSS